jgi:hypothetical protein
VLHPSSLPTSRVRIHVLPHQFVYRCTGYTTGASEVAFWCHIYPSISPPATLEDGSACVFLRTWPARERDEHPSLTYSSSPISSIIRCTYTWFKYPSIKTSSIIQVHFVYFHMAVTRYAFSLPRYAAVTPLLPNPRATII